MRFEYVTPESAGISSKQVLKFIKTLDKYNFCTHSIIMARGNKVFTEAYYAPFTKDALHRMYSVTKSFVSIAIGMAQDDGLLSIDDKFVKYFPEYEEAWKDDELFKETTIRDMLKMEGCSRCGEDWFTSCSKDRTEVYFRKPADKIPGTFFQYDSAGSYMLGVIVEKVTGKPFLEYMKEKALNEIGFSSEAYCLKTPGGHSWGDSGLMCRPVDLLTFARFVMEKGYINNKQYVSRDYIEQAVKKQVCNSTFGYNSVRSYGYGYQIWKAPRDGFVFTGMGDQLSICDPKTDFVFVITSDNQGSDNSRNIIFHTLYEDIIEKFTDFMEESFEDYKVLKQYTENLKLFALPEESNSSLPKKIHNKRYILNENNMGIEYVEFCFEDKKGLLKYKNNRGEKVLTFGIGYNEFAKFPEEGYSDMVGTEYAQGNMYDCACSADFPEENKLRIKVQIIDKYFGNGGFVFSFKDNRIGVEMKVNAEHFMKEYCGTAEGFLENGGV